MEENAPVTLLENILHFSRTVPVPDLISDSEEHCECGTWVPCPHLTSENTEGQGGHGSANWDENITSLIFY